MRDDADTAGRIPAPEKWDLPPGAAPPATARATTVKRTGSCWSRTRRWTKCSTGSSAYRPPSRGSGVCSCRGSGGDCNDGPPNRRRTHRPAVALLKPSDLTGFREGSIRRISRNSETSNHMVSTEQPAVSHEQALPRPRKRHENLGLRGGGSGPVRSLTGREPSPPQEGVGRSGRPRPDPLTG